MNKTALILLAFFALASVGFGAVTDFSRPPVVRISYSPTAVDASSYVTITATASSTVGVDYIDIYVGGFYRKTCFSSPCSYTTIFGAAGSYSYYAEATDINGNMGTSLTGYINVGTSAATQSCGNGKKEGTEQCDDPNYQNGVQCIPAYGGSCTYCDSSCNLKTLAGGTCGDGVCNSGETPATCAADCVQPALCGDSKVSGNEQCDGTYMGFSTCASLGYAGGNLSCNPPGSKYPCTYDTTGCTYTTPVQGPANTTISCSPGQTLCNNVCVSIQTDSNNCGACGNACAAGQTCQNAVCASPANSGGLTITFHPIAGFFNFTSANTITLSGSSITMQTIVCGTVTASPTRIEFYIDGNLNYSAPVTDSARACSQIAAPSYTYRLTSGTHSLYAIVYDNAGHSATSDTLTAIVPGTTTNQSYTCSDLVNRGPTYFDSCRNGGFQGVCFNRFTGAYQGCSQGDGYGCTSSNTNAANNIVCMIPATTTPESIAAGNCNDKTDNDNNGEVDYDGLPRGDVGCPVGVTAIRAAPAAQPNSQVQVMCGATVAHVSSIQAWLDKQKCEWDPSFGVNGWDGTTTQFICDTGSIGTKTATCTVNPRVSYQRGPDQMAQVNVACETAPLICPDGSEPVISYPKDGSCPTYTCGVNTTSVDLKLNGQDGPLDMKPGTEVKLSWTSSNAVACVASGQWSDSKPLSGSEIVTLPSSIYASSVNYIIACTDSTGYGVSDYVQVNIEPVTLQVIYPKGSETWQLGSTQTIEWSLPVQFSPTVDIYLDPCTSDSCPPQVPYIIKQGIPNTGKFDWTMGNDQAGSQIPAGSYKVRITYGPDPTKYFGTSEVFKITPAQQIKPPEISSVQVLKVSPNSAKISWLTDVPADSRVKYGIDPAALGLSATDPVFATNRVLSINNLNPSTTYYFTVSSCDKNGLCTVSGTSDFTTTGTPAYCGTITSSSTDPKCVCNSGETKETIQPECAADNTSCPSMYYCRTADQKLPVISNGQPQTGTAPDDLLVVQKIPAGPYGAFGTDSAGNIYTMTSGGSYTQRSISISKYNLQGILQGQTSFNSSAGAEIRQTFFDKSGNYYQLGRSPGGQAYIERYGIDGKQWSRTVGPVVAGGSGVASGGTVDKNGNVYITGLFENNDYFTNYARKDSLLVAKFDSSGSLNWYTDTNPEASSGLLYNRDPACTSGYMIGADDAENVYLIGYIHQPCYGIGSATSRAQMSASGPFGRAMWFAKYDPSGNLKWGKFINQLGGFSLSGTLGAVAVVDMYVDANGNTYMTGGGKLTRIDPSGGASTTSGDFPIHKYDAQGNLVSSQEYDIPTLGAVQLGTRVLTDFTGNTYTLEQEQYTNGTKSTYYLVKFTGANNYVIARNLDSLITANSMMAPDLKVDNNGIVYMNDNSGVYALKFNSQTPPAPATPATPTTPVVTVTPANPATPTTPPAPTTTPTTPTTPPPTTTTPAAQPSITVTSPNGGETWYSNTVQSVTWASSNLGTSNVVIRLIDSLGNARIILSSTPNDGAQNVYVPIVSGKYKIEVKATSPYVTVSDMSDSYFVITAAPAITYNTYSTVPSYKGSTEII